MMDQYYKIAGLTVVMDTFGMTEQRAQRYRCAPSESVDIRVVSHWEQNKHKHPGCSDDVGEHMSTAVDFYKKLLDFDGMMLHASAVVVDGWAYLFTANSGVGKSTHTTLWLNAFGERAYILNDDKPALRREDGRWYAYGTPWSGKHDISLNVRVPVAGIACLSRAEENSIEPFSGTQAISSVFRQVNRPPAQESRIKLLQLLDRLISEVPIWKLSCNKEPQAALIAYTAMNKGKDSIE